MTNQTAISLPVPAAVGNIETYIEAAHRMPMLTQEEETALARRFRDNGDLDAARTLVLSHLRLVVAIARGYLGYGLPHADLIQEGNIGLMKAVKRFDPDRGVRLVSFALYWIKAEIHEFILKNWRLVKVATTKAQRKLFFNLRSLKNALAADSALTPGQAREIADTLGVKPEEVREMESRMEGREVALEGQGGEDEEHQFHPIDWLADSREEPEAVLERTERARLQGEGLQGALATLDPRSRRIVEARWLADEGQSATLHELAAEFGVSAERIRQIEGKALRTMRASLA
jgi:RNA polymerase sigma-32 factor